MTYDELIAAYKQAEADKAYTPIFEQRQMEGGEGGGGTSSFYVGDDTSSYTTPQGLLYRDPATGITTLRRPAGFSGRDLEILSGDPSGKVTSEYLKAPAPSHQNFLKFLGGVGAAAFGLPALGEALGAAAAPAAAGGELAGLASLGGTSAYGLPAGATVLMDGTVVSAAGEVLGTAPATFGSVVPGAAAGAGATGSSLASTLGSKAAQTVGGQLLNRALRGSNESTAGGVNPALLAALLGGGGRSAFSPVSDKTYKPTLMQQGNLYEAGIPSLVKAEPSKSVEQNEEAGTMYMAHGGLAGIAPQQYAAGGRFLSGPGDGTSDSIRANIEGKQEARLADGEFVLPADIVSHIGNGSSKAGAEKLYAMMDNIRRARTGTAKMGKTIKADKYLPA